MVDEIGAVPDRTDFRVGKAYTIWQAAGLARISAATVRRWLEIVGHDDETAPDAIPMLSFLELIELVVVARFRAPPSPVKLERIAQAHEFAKKEFGLPFPFANLNLRKYGGHVLHRFDVETQTKPSRWLALDLGGQYALPGLVQAELERNVIYPDNFAGVWYPRGRDVPIIVDPYRAGGRPTIEGSGVTVETVRRRFYAGETLTDLARDYGLRRITVDKAVQAGV